MTTSFEPCYGVTLLMYNTFVEPVTMVNEYLGQWHSVVVFIDVPALKCTKVKLNIILYHGKTLETGYVGDWIGLML